MNSFVNSHNPFVAGPIVRAENFLDREKSLRKLFSRIGHPDVPQSTAITGQPHIGKTSLLWKLIDSETQKHYLNDAAQGVICQIVNLHEITSDYSINNFWHDVLEPLSRQPGHSSVSNRINHTVQEDFSTQTLINLFSYLAKKRQQRLVLLLDEFERILVHTNFQDPSFFASLRSISSNTGGLVLVTASRLSVTEMNEHGRGLLDVGSPFFNHMIEWNLPPFSEDAIKTLLDQAGDRFSQSDHQFVRRMAGSSPYLLQALAQALFDSAENGEKRLISTFEEFYKGVAHHFSDLWYSLDDQTRTAAVMLSQHEFGREIFNERYKKNKGIQKSKLFEVEIGKLAELGLAEEIEKGGIIWNKKLWRISSSAFAYWVRNVVVAQARHIDKHDEWLKKQKYRIFLTQVQWDSLKGVIPGIRDFAADTIARIVKSFVEGG